jgi:DNA-binding response OmpR family regulator
MSREIIAGLEARGHDVVHVQTAARVLEELGNRTIDLIVLDLLLTDVDGLILLDNIQRIGSYPTIIVSRTHRRSDCVLGLRLGADDFVLTPIEMDELDARVQAILRRRNGGPRAQLHLADELRLGAVVVDALRARVTIGRAPLALTPIQYRILVSLLRAPEHILTKLDMAQEVWGYADPNTIRTLDVHLSALRQKLRLAGASAPTIRSLRIQAYRLAPGSAPDESAGGRRVAST